MESKIKATLQVLINLGGNVIVLGIVPPQYKVWALLIFNIAQVLYAYFDPTYVFEQLGKKLGKVYTKADLK